MTDLVFTETYYRGNRDLIHADTHRDDGRRKISWPENSRVQKDLLQGQERPITCGRVSKETYYRGKRDLIYADAHRIS
jgi:hypothetical protein